ncbi:Cathepsin_L [Hexamita inflata]|uniref:Cathepsin_L n=1 Tax=Hexamita inflata TaxID=28002 RepID=A0ABP1GIM7_9EUKA
MLTIYMMLQTNIHNQECYTAFIDFKLKYNKNYGGNEQERFDIFCQNYMKQYEKLEMNMMLEINISSTMDQEQPHETENSVFKRTLNLLNAATNDQCSTTNPLSDKIVPYSTVDLREMNLITPVKSQGASTASSVFQTIAILENSILRDKQNLNAFWQDKATSTTLSLSEQFYLSNSICSACTYEGGLNFAKLAYLMVSGNLIQSDFSYASIKTVELTENFPADFVNKQATWQSKTNIAPILDSQNWLLPIQLFNNNGLYKDQCNLQSPYTPIVKIFDDNAAVFNETTIKTIKQYLSSGLAIAFNMYIGSGTSAAAFRNYAGGGQILSSTKCNLYKSDSYVTLVGYGKKNNKNVWVLKTSMGSSWGDQGHFFVEIGQNSFCTEQYAYTIIPKHFNIAQTTPYPQGTQIRGQTYTLDCDTYYTVVNSVTTCYSQCPPQYPVVVSGTYVCIQKCPDATPYSDAGSCVERCSTAAYSVVSGQQTLVCQDSCTFYVLNATNANSQQCLAACTDDLPYSDAGLCCARCPKGAYSLQVSVRVCQDACPAFFITNASNGNSLQCVDPCPPPMVSVGQECFGACSSGLPFLENAVCVERCQTGAYTDDRTNLNCGPACTGMYILNASNGNSQKCITACPPETPYYEPGACLVKCSSGFYDLHPGAVQELVCAASCPIYLVNASSDNSKQCVSKCPDAAPYSDAGSCVERCSTAAYSVVSANKRSRLPGFVHLLRAESPPTRTLASCLAACTGDLPYSDAGLCAGCPKGIIFSRSRCRVCQKTRASVLHHECLQRQLAPQCVDPCPPPMVSMGQECFAPVLPAFRFQKTPCAWKGARPARTPTTEPS